jgi:hypothetical protein
MPAEALASVLVTGSANPMDRRAIRAARMVALTLAEHGFPLVTGNSTGVDKAVATAYCYELRRRQQSIEERFLQLRLPWWRRGGFWPSRSFSPPRDAVRRVRYENDWLQDARTTAAAAVILGGKTGTLRLANRFIDAGKPVLPVPFTGGTSSDVFQEVLRNWSDNPVPGLSRSQFLRLAVPWVAGTGALADLLMGTLSTTPAIFVSYRRADTEWVAGRLRQDLAEHFGSRRVFLDLEHIVPGDMWDRRIEDSLRQCRVGIVVVGGQWLDTAEGAAKPRLTEEDDVLRREIRTLLAENKPIVVLMTPDAPAPPWPLPDDIARLNKFQAVTVTPGTWTLVLEQVIRTIKPLLRP